MMTQWWHCDCDNYGEGTDDDGGGGDNTSDSDGVAYDLLYMKVET